MAVREAAIRVPAFAGKGNPLTHRGCSPTKTYKERV